jgi:DNA helicase-2/ATP-dependent DNA helicase PcrA
MPDGRRDEPWLDGVKGDAGKVLILCDKPFIQVVAGPGSGKTFGLQRRVRRLVQGSGVRRSLIFVGTFTRAIRDALIAELEPVDSKTPADERLNIETLHSQAYKMLREYPAARPGRDFRFLLEHEEAAMLYDIRDVAPGLDFDGLKSAMQKVESYWSMAAPLEDERFRGAMVAWLERHHAMHVNEVVHIALTAVNRGDLPAGTYLHVIVDEYQDLTAAEQQLVARLCGEGSLMVLGDDDQSIYQFRYNHPGGITDFPKDKDPAKLASITIEENRRCGTTIVDFANRLMAAAGTKKKPMVSVRGEDGVVELVRWRSAEEEVDGLARYAGSQTQTRFLILVPHRVIGYKLRDRLGEEAWTSFHEEVLRTELVRERFALAALLANEEDAVALRAWFGFKGNQAARAPQQNAPAIKSIRDSGLFGRQLMEGIVAGTVMVAGTGRDAIRQRAAMYLRLSQEAEPLSLQDKIGYLFNPDLAATVEDPEKQRYARDDLTLLRDSALQLADHRETTLLRIIDTLRYRISTRQPLLEGEPDARIRIMTLYGAKGLEADAIIVAGLADNILPGKDDKDKAKIETRRDEQRRLLYVAITRAQRQLILSWPLSMAYADARRWNVRIDRGTVLTIKGSKVVRLGGCRFIPQGLASTEGRAWLAAKGI